MLKYTQSDDDPEIPIGSHQKSIVREGFSFLWYKAGTIVLESIK